MYTELSKVQNSSNETSVSGNSNTGFVHSQDDITASINAPSKRQYGSLVSGPITYTWKDINAVAKIKTNAIKSLVCKGKSVNEPKQILRNVSGVARPGEILAIMGASGAGKTSLLNVITFRNTGSLSVTGSKMVNGVPIDADALTLLSAYIQQDDMFIGTLTPREHLTFQALLRMNKGINYKERMRRVEEIIMEMGLVGCADTVIGIAGRIKGISGGQQKRLSVASEILTDPQLLICDEPTTGLDSFMALHIIKTLKTLANKGKTIICTIHQPASQIFILFDKLLLMSEGRVAYNGDAQQATSYFSSIGYPCPVNFNPADFYIRTLGIKPGSENSCLQQSNELCDKFDESSIANAINSQVNAKVTDQTLLKSLKAAMKLRQKSPYKASWFSQFRACLWHSGIVILRDPLVLKVQLMQTIFMSLLVGLAYFGQDNDQEGIQNISGCIFGIMVNVTFSSLFPVMNVFWQELPVFLREHSNGVYRTDAYYLAKSFAELPVYVCLPVLYISIAYFMIGLNPDINRFLIAVLIVVLVANVGSSIGYMASTITPSFNVTMALSSVFTTPFMLFGGKYLNKDSIPVYFNWLKYLSSFLHGNEAMSINQWKGVTEIKCNSNLPCIENGEQVLESISFEEDNFATALAVLGGLIVGTRFISFLGLALKTRKTID